MIVRQFKIKKLYAVQEVLSIFSKNKGIFYFKNYNKITIGLFPKHQFIGLDSHITRIEKRDGLLFQNILKDTDIFTLLKDYWKANQHLTQRYQPDSNEQFSGGLMGFIGYDLAAAQSVALKNSVFPSALFGDYDIFLQSDESVGQDDEHSGWQLYGPDDPALQPIYDFIQQTFAMYENAKLPKYSLIVQQPFKAVWSYQQYYQAFNKIQNYLVAGDCYQINLTQPFKAQVSGQLLACLDALENLTHAVYAGYVCVDDFELLSCSPELFLKFDADRQVITRPIKGTRPRSRDVLHDTHLKAALADSEKDRSENLMIVDLLRNDLSVYAETSSVQVPVLFEIESFAQVHHLVSEIQATLKPDVSPIDVLLTALPGGSITGAPKIRAMQIIDELEAEPRGAYCGSMGYLNYDGTGVFNILIRTLQRHGDTLTAWAGGGITVASKCEDEYQECLDKIGAILNCVNTLNDKN